MDFNLSDIKFPKYVTGMLDIYGEWLLGGYDYQTQAPGWTRALVLQEVRDFNISAFNWHINQDGTGYTDPYPVFTYPNGYYVGVTITQGEQSGAGLRRGSIASNWYDADGNAVGNITGYQSYYNNNESFNIEYGNLYDGDAILSIFLDTVYYPNANPPTDTPNNGLFLLACAGFQSQGYSLDAGYITGRPGGVWQWCKPIGGWSDLQSFATYLHANGEPFNGDPFTDDPTVGPAGGGDTSGTGGGGGNYDPTSDPIDFPALPTGGALTSGMIKGFVMNPGNLATLQSKLWDISFFDIATQFQKLVSEPMDCIISLHCLPFTPTAGNTEEIKLGSFSTSVQANRAISQYEEVDAGTIDVKEYWGSALDYAPYTRVEIYVPFVGFRNLQIEDIQGVTLAMKYHVDVLTGDCVAYLKCGNSVLYTWTGNCLAHVPCTSQSSDLLAKNISAVGMTGLGLVTGNPAATAAGAMSGAVNSATAKDHVQRSGDVAGSPGLMSEFIPYLVFHRPKQSLAKGYNKFKGYPANITYTLSSLKGYTEVEHVHLTNIEGATDAELQQIESLLKNGVII